MTIYHLFLIGDGIVQNPKYRPSLFLKTILHTKGRFIGLNFYIKFANNGFLVNDKLYLG